MFSFSNMKLKLKLKLEPKTKQKMPNFQTFLSHLCGLSVLEIGVDGMNHVKLFRYIPRSIMLDGFKVGLLVVFSKRAC